jgi:hypothetical protein
VEVIAGDREGRGRVGDDGRRNAQVHERSDDHVARETAGSIEKESLADPGAAGEVLARGGAGMRVFMTVIVIMTMFMAILVIVRVVVIVIVFAVGVRVLHLV